VKKIDEKKEQMKKSILWGENGGNSFEKMQSVQKCAGKISLRESA